MSGKHRTRLHKAYICVMYLMPPPRAPPPFPSKALQLTCRACPLSKPSRLQLARVMYNVITWQLSHQLAWFPHMRYQVLLHECVIAG